ncbi:MAG: hypothetical protein JWO36_6636 [Myxococcales bacterium]|nr:hypothetical protein [Myxococcales bacterium]
MADDTSDEFDPVAAVLASLDKMAADVESVCREVQILSGRLDLIDQFQAGRAFARVSHLA